MACATKSVLTFLRGVEECVALEVPDTLNYNWLKLASVLRKTNGFNMTRPFTVIINKLVLLQNRSMGQLRFKSLI